MSETSLLIQDIVDMSREGTAFYEEAAKSVEDKNLGKVFAQLAKAKSELADNLSSELKPRKGSRATGNGLDSLSETYAGARGQMKKVSASCLTALEHSESLLQQTLNRIVFDRQSQFVLRVHAKKYVGLTEEFKSRMRQSLRKLPG